uniref:Vomeronasal type-1 receptor n=1 Tax=Phocoena sinus TaxID=42100 RepID=A0A8C9CAM4_PHOSS
MALRDILVWSSLDCCIKFLRIRYSTVTILQIFFISQVGTWNLGNLFKKPTDTILMHITLANIMTIMFRGIQDAMSSFGIWPIMGDIGCKSLLYIPSMTQGISLCTISILNTFQAIKISPGNSKWVWLKPQTSTCVLPSFLFFWVINMLVCIWIITNNETVTNASAAQPGYSPVYCKTKRGDYRESAVFQSAMLIRVFLCINLTVWTSGCMVMLLYNHHKTIQNLHGNNLSPRPSPETKATNTTLLVSCFVFFCWLNMLLENIIGFLSSCYPAMCPLVMLKNASRISCLNSSLAKMRMLSNKRELIVMAWSPPSLPLNRRIHCHKSVLKEKTQY